MNLCPESLGSGSNAVGLWIISFGRIRFWIGKSNQGCQFNRPLADLGRVFIKWNSGPFDGIVKQCFVGGFRLLFERGDGRVDFLIQHEQALLENDLDGLVLILLELFQLIANLCFGKTQEDGC